MVPFAFGAFCSMVLTSHDIPSLLVLAADARVFTVSHVKELRELENIAIQDISRYLESKSFL